MLDVKNGSDGTSLAVQWFRLHAPNAGGTGLIPGQETKIPHDMQSCLKKTKRGGGRIDDLKNMRIKLIKNRWRASLVVQWLRICLLMQGTQVRALVWEDPTCRGATRPVSHNY